MVYRIWTRDGLYGSFPSKRAGDTYLSENGWEIKAAVWTFRLDNGQMLYALVSDLLSQHLSVKDICELPKMWKKER